MQQRTRSPAIYVPCLIGAGTVPRLLGCDSEIRNDGGCVPGGCGRSSRRGNRLTPGWLAVH